MAWSLTAVQLQSINVISQGGQATQVQITVNGTDSGSNVQQHTFTETLSGAQQATVTNLLTALATVIATQTGLAVTLA